MQGAITTHCLNCSTPLQGAYCHQCGQKSSTHRYSLKSLLTHDLIHSLWHVDKSILRSWWRAIIRPGNEAAANIAGKRAGQFPVLTLAIFITILFLLSLGLSNEEQVLARFGTFDVSEWVRHNAKWLWLSLIIFYAWSERIFFRRAQFNYAEHVVMATYHYVGLFSIFAVYLVAYHLAPASWAWMDWFSVLLLFGYLSFANWQSYRRFYTFGGWFWRLLGSTLFFWGVLFGLLVLLGIFFSGAERMDIEIGTQSQAIRDSLRR